MQRNYSNITAVSPSNTSTTVVDISRRITVAAFDQLQSGISPLIPSLLMSPTLAAAPTITTVVSSASIPIFNISQQEALPDTSMPVTTIATQDFWSTSQVAPILSMLLKGTEVTGSNLVLHGLNTGEKQLESSCELQCVATDTNYEEVPMDLEEEVCIYDINTNPATAIDSDEPGNDEEQQLADIFRNIESIDELIDNVEIDFFKCLDEKSPHEFTDIINAGDEVVKAVTESEKETTSFEIKKGAAEMQSKFRMLTANNKTDNFRKWVAVPKKEKKVEQSSEHSDDNIPLTSLKQKSEEQSNNIYVSEKSADVTENEKSKLETVSSDDDEDNIPLAALKQKSVEQNNKIYVSKKSAKVAENKKPEIETVPSDDDEDNIPLAALKQKSVGQNNKIYVSKKSAKVTENKKSKIGRVSSEEDDDSIPLATFKQKYAQIRSRGCSMDYKINGMKLRSGFRKRQHIL